MFATKPRGIIVLTVLLAACFALTNLGCHSVTTRPRADNTAPPVDPLAMTQGADLERNTEVELVEQMARGRTNYQQNLELLKEFYDRQGNQMKTTWAQQELEHLRLGPQRPYLVVAEIAGPDLRASTAIVEADLLYREGLEYFKEATSGLFMDKKKLYLAIDKFNELITTFPHSDKIGDAAFQLGEIHNKHMKDPVTALLYYQRVWQWDPQTPMPARFGAARVYDEQLFDRARALQLYEQAINLESSYPENVLYAQNRISEIQKQLEN